MRIHINVNDRAVRRPFRGQRYRHRPLTVLDLTLPAFGFTVAADDTRTFFVRVRRKLWATNIALGKTTELTAAEARGKAIAEIEAARAERETGPLMRDFADEFIHREARRWKPSTREGNRDLLRRYVLPFFGEMPVAGITRADVQRWFASMSATPGNANRVLPVLSVMMRRAELCELRRQGSNPCRNMRRYRTTPRERFLSAEELERLGSVLDHAEDQQAAAAIRLLLFTGARSSEITGLKWDWIQGSRAILPDSKTGPKTIQLPAPARAVLAALPRVSAFVFPDGQGDGPMADLGKRWHKLRRLAGLEDVRVHDCRHTYASHAVMIGLDLYTVGRLLGHADTAATERYAHLADDHIREAAGHITTIVGDAMSGGRKGEAGHGA